MWKGLWTKVRVRCNNGSEDGMLVRIALNYSWSFLPKGCPVSSCGQCLCYPQQPRVQSAWWTAETWALPKSFPWIPRQGEGSMQGILGDVMNLFSWCMPSVRSLGVAPVTQLRPCRQPASPTAGGPVREAKYCFLSPTALCSEYGFSTVGAPLVQEQLPLCPLIILCLGLHYLLGTSQIIIHEP